MKGLYKFFATWQRIVAWSMVYGTITGAVFGGILLLWGLLAYLSRIMGEQFALAEYIQILVALIVWGAFGLSASAFIGFALGLGFGILEGLGYAFWLQLLQTISRNALLFWSIALGAGVFAGVLNGYFAFRYVRSNFPDLEISIGVVVFLYAVLCTYFIIKRIHPQPIHEMSGAKLNA